MVSSPRFGVVGGTARSDQLIESGCARSTTGSAAMAPTVGASRRSTVLSFVCWAGVGIRARKAPDRSATTTIAERRTRSDGRTFCCCNATCNDMSDTVLRANWRKPTRPLSQNSLFLLGR